MVFLVMWVKGCLSLCGVLVCALCEVVVVTLCEGFVCVVWRCGSLVWGMRGGSFGLACW